MDNIDSGDIDLDSITDAHQRMLEAYRIAEAKTVEATPKPELTPIYDSHWPKTNGAEVKYVHPNWVNANQKPWLDKGLWMIPRIPDGLTFEAHPGWYELNTPEHAPILTLEQEKAMALGATSWLEYFKMQDAGLDKPCISGASTIANTADEAPLLIGPADPLKPSKPIVSDESDIFPPGLQLMAHPEYFGLNYEELIIQQREAFELNCRDWVEYATLKDCMLQSTKPPEMSKEIEKPQSNDVKKKPMGLIPLTGVSNIYTSRPRNYSAPDEMGAVTRLKHDVPFDDWNKIAWNTYSKEEKESIQKLHEKFGDNKSWDSYTKEDHQAIMKLYNSQQKIRSSDDEDPRGKVHKPSTGKTNPWEAHAWIENSDEEYNVGMYDNYESDPNGDGVEFVDSGDENKGYGEVLDAMEQNNIKAQKQSVSTKELVTQLVERAEEVAVVVEAISGDSKEISRDVAELGPLLTDTNEDVRNIRDEIKKINTRLTAVENALNKIAVSTTSLNSMMEIIVTHFTKDDADLR